MATLTVRGRAVAPAEPDEATIVLELSSLQPTADVAYRDVAERNALVARLVQEAVTRAPARIQATIDVEAGERLARAAVDVTFVLEQG